MSFQTQATSTNEYNKMSILNTYRVQALREQRPLGRRPEPGFQRSAQFRRRPKPPADEFWTEGPAVRGRGHAAAVRPVRFTCQAAAAGCPIPGLVVASPGTPSLSNEVVNMRKEVKRI
ncbi:Serum Response Factor-Binding Protein 1 [Manis pentadactyla]|nr:Serum Response Factor-Binding Protein 1 [Manis pentadactyla]